jgi:hypothetical protein
MFSSWRHATAGRGRPTPRRRASARTRQRPGRVFCTGHRRWPPPCLSAFGATGSVLCSATSWQHSYEFSFVWSGTAGRYPKLAERSTWTARPLSTCSSQPSAPFGSHHFRQRSFLSPSDQPGGPARQKRPASLRRRAFRGGRGADRRTHSMQEHAQGDETDIVLDERSLGHGGWGLSSSPEVW